MKTFSLHPKLVAAPCPFPRLTLRILSGVEGEQAQSLPLLPDYVKFTKHAVKQAPSIPDKIVLNEAEYALCYGHLIHSLRSERSAIRLKITTVFCRI